MCYGIITFNFRPPLALIFDCTLNFASDSPRSSTLSTTWLGAVHVHVTLSTPRDRVSPRILSFLFLYSQLIPTASMPSSAPLRCLFVDGKAVWKIPYSLSRRRRCLVLILQPDCWDVISARHDLQESWAPKTGFRFSPSKTISARFGRKRESYPDLSLFLWPGYWHVRGGAVCIILV